MTQTNPKTTGKASNGPLPVFFRTNSNNPGIIPIPEVRTRKTLLKFEQIDICRQQGNCAGWENSFRLGALR